MSGKPAAALDVLIVGAGFAGIYMLFKARRIGLDARLIEAAAGVGGTWYFNRYPGARVDIQSMEYSFQFSEALQQEWHWTERYAAQPELLRYANHVVDRFGLRDGIQLNTRVTSAVFDEDAQRWRVGADNGDSWSACEQPGFHSLGPRRLTQRARKNNRRRWFGNHGRSERADRDLTLPPGSP